MKVEDERRVEDWIERHVELDQMQADLLRQAAADHAELSQLWDQRSFRVLLYRLFAFCRPDVPTTALALVSDGDGGRVVRDYDPNGRISAHNDGKRAVFQHILELTQPAAAGRQIEVEVSDSETVQ